MRVPPFLLPELTYIMNELDGDFVFVWSTLSLFHYLFLYLFIHLFIIYYPFVIYLFISLSIYLFIYYSFIYFSGSRLGWGGVGVV